MKGASAIFDFVLAADARGERCALVTLTDITGSSSRSIGAHIAVSQTGAYYGSFTGGCLEAAIVADAQRVIASGEARLIRFGAGSPYIDIRLPCGGGLDLLFTPLVAVDLLSRVNQTLATRSGVALALGRDGSIALLDAVPARSGWAGERFVAVHEPDLRLVILGQGDEVRAMAALALAYGAKVVVLSPDQALVESLVASDIAAGVLKTPDRTAQLVADRHSAIVMLFHDHDWETGLLAQAAATEAFFIGAMGSRKAHARRKMALLQHGVAPADIDRIIGPIGLIAATRDPQTLALSALSQIVELHEAMQQTFPRLKEQPLTRIVAGQKV